MNWTFAQVVILMLFGAMLGIPLGWMYGHAAGRRTRGHAKHFRCPVCKWRHAKADEDGCCAACGMDCEVEVCACPPKKGALDGSG